MRLPRVLAVAAIITTLGVNAWAGDVVTIKIPRRSQLTPVQKLNREGVEAVKRLQYDKASALFYKAYLYDPADPFTLNNLGYISELQGELEKARKFYKLASEQGSNATIDISNTKQLQGQPMEEVFASLKDVPMRVNRMNVDAMDLLDANRGFEAVALLHKAQQLDGSNPFTLNNLGVADETIGDFAGALKAYDDAAMTRSNERVLVTADKAWRGKSVSAMAWDSAKRLQSRISKMDAGEQSSVLYTVRGVSATNQNNLTEARADFLKAYSLDPKSAFSINNRGFVAEIDGDVETAEFYYDKARRAGDANARIGLSTQPGAEGKRLLTVAADSDHLMGDELDRYSQQRRRDNSPVELTPRGDASNAGAKSPSGQPLAVPPPAQPQQ